MFRPDALAVDRVAEVPRLAGSDPLAAEPAVDLPPAHERVELLAAISMRSAVRERQASSEAIAPEQESGREMKGAYSGHPDLGDARRVLGESTERGSRHADFARLRIC